MNAYTSRWPRALAAASLSAALLLGGCGGGGDSGTTTSTTVSLLAIDQANSTQVAGAVYQSVMAAGASGEAGSSVLTGAVVSGTTSGTGLARFAQDQIARFLSLGYLPGSNLAAAVVYTQTVTCDTPSVGSAGTITISWDDADNSKTLTAGDTLSATFNNCYSATDGTTINGGLGLSGLTVSGDPTAPLTPWDVTATFAFTNLAITEVSGTQTLNGGFAYAGSTPDGVTVTGNLKGANLSIAQTSMPTLALKQFDLTSTVDNSSTAYTETGSGQVFNSDWSGAYVEFQVTKPFQGLGSENPSSGSAKISGANNSSVTLTAIDSTTVQLEVDANGDGVVDATTTNTWDSLHV